MRVGLQLLGVAVVTVALGGCSTARSALDPAAMVAPSPDVPAEYREVLSLEEIEGLQPQLRFPIKLAISQPSSGSGWTADEIAIIESWEEPLRATGFVDSIVVLPESLSESCGWGLAYHCGVLRNRRAAARFHADALLFVAAQTEVRQYANPASILNLTVVGLWLVPAHHRNATTVLERTLIDNRNEYVYAFSRAYGEVKMVRPLAYSNWRRSADLSRQRALADFGSRMLAELEKYDVPAPTP